MTGRLTEGSRLPPSPERDRVWSSHGFTSEGTRFADTRAYDFELSAWTDETPRGRSSRQPMPARMLVDHGRPVRAVRRLDHGAHRPRRRVDAQRGRVDEGWRRDASGEEPLRRHEARSSGRTRLRRPGSGWCLSGRYAGSSTRRGPRRAHSPWPDAGPPGRSGAETIFDATHRRVLLFGGKNDSGTLGDLWELRLPEPH